MNKYIGVKIVHAQQLSALEARAAGHKTGESPDEEIGYEVEYPGGYRSWCPKIQFEEANRACDAMPLGHAIEAARKGLKIARAGWNGKNQFVVFIKSGNAMYHTYDMQDCFGLKNQQGEMQPGWVPSQGDMKADDWCIVE